MDEPQASAFSRKQFVVAVAAAAVIGFGAGILVGRKWEEPHAPELPCPSCRIERVPNTHLCELVGQIDPAWPAAKSPLKLMSPLEQDGFHPGDCFRIPVACGDGVGPALQFKQPLSALPFATAWCSSGCVERMTCSP